LSIFKSDSIKKAVVLLSGNGSNFQAILDSITADEIALEISSVISNVSGARGVDRAKTHGIPTHIVNNNNYSDRISFDKALLDKVVKYNPDYLILAGFMRILSPEFIKKFNKPIFNIHPSLLPEYKGLNTHQRVLDKNEKIHGCSVHLVTNELDAGPLIIQGEVPVKNDDDVKKLAARVLKVEHMIYKKALNLFITNQITYDNLRVIKINNEIEIPLKVRVN
tara:strand:+ start:91 stop:756 length:666 start_codon:yes stop_codon:yes gene_type:complete